MKSSNNGEQAALDLLTRGWDGLFAGHGRALLAQALPAWMQRQRWFGAKTRVIARLEISRWAELPVAVAAAILPAGTLPAVSTLGDAIVLVDLAYTDGSTDRYQVPLAFTTGDAGGLPLPSVVLSVATPTGAGTFYDATVREEFRQALLGLIEHEASLPVEDVRSAAAHVAAELVAAHEGRPVHDVSAAQAHEIAEAILDRQSIETSEVAPAFVGHMPGAAGSAPALALAHPQTESELCGARTSAFEAVRGHGSLAARVHAGEQSNTNVIYGDRMLLKMFRRLIAGENPDLEIGRYLTEVARFPRIAPLLGVIAVGDTSLAMLQGLVANEGDGWAWTLGELASFYERATSLRFTEAEGLRLAGGYAQAAALLGRRTAELHTALAAPDGDADFAPEPLTAADFDRDAVRIRAQIATALAALERGLDRLSGDCAAEATMVLERRAELLERAGRLASPTPSGARIRIHGDYHLGQVLRAGDDFVLLDFEGEPARSLEERRRKQSPLRDVAGMLRSFSYVAYAGLQAAPRDLHEGLQPWARTWEDAVCAAFLEGYRSAIEVRQTLLPEAAQARVLLEAYLLEKALYELQYELDNRPAWVGIPLAGIRSLLDGK